MMIADNGLMTLDMNLSSFETVKKMIISAVGMTPLAKRALLASDEALRNIIRYSGATELTFSCKWDGNSLELMFQDNGKEFDPTAVKLTDGEFDALSEGGMGIKIMRRSADHITHSFNDKKNKLTLGFDTTKANVQ